MRMHHYLKFNESTQSPSNMLIVDTEAKIAHLPNGGQAQTFRLGYAIHVMRKGAEWFETGYELRSIEDFWKLLDRFAYEKKRLYVFAHNMAYDYAILKLDSYISSRTLEIKMRVIDSVFMVRAGNILFLSSTNYYRQSLAQLGNIFGLSKMNPPDFEKCTDLELMPYCMRDTQVLSHVMKAHIDFIKTNNLGNFKPTIAGQAFTVYRHRFMHHQLLVHNYPDILMMESESYRGGRCEVFKMGKHDNITCLDINSMYPYVMKSFEYPTKLITSNAIMDFPVCDLPEVLSKYFVLARCELDMQEPVLGIRQDGKLIFPIGRMHPYITSPEIQYIVEHPECGKIIAVDELVTYEKAHIFAEYVDYFYTFRQTTTNTAYKQMAKILLNSLYGKFGQHNSTFPQIVTDDSLKSKYFSMMEVENTFEIFVGLTSKYVRLGSDLYRIDKDDKGFAHDSIPIIASAVTSYARILLYTLIKIAGREHVLYCDTDSMFVTPEGVSRLHDWISESELGKLKVEKSGTVEIRGCKDYTFNGEVKLKGVKHNAIKLANGSYTQFNFLTKNSRYRDAIPDGTVMLEPVVKTLSREYTKGTVWGEIVLPFILDKA